MARTNIPVQPIPIGTWYDAEVTWTSADDVNDHDFENTGNEILLVKNDSAGALDTTVVSVADKNGRSGDLTISTGASKISSAGPFPPGLWNSESGKMYVNLTDDTSMSYAVIRFFKIG